MGAGGRLLVLQSDGCQGAAGKAASREWPHQREGRWGARQGAWCADNRLLDFCGQGQGVRCCTRSGAKSLALTGDSKGRMEDKYRKVP